MRTPQHDTWIFDTFGVRMPGPSGAAPHPSRFEKLRAAGRALASGGRIALGALSQGEKRAGAEVLQGARSGGAVLGADLKHAGGNLVQGATGALHDVTDGARHGHLAAGLLQAREHLDAKSSQAVGDAWHGLTGLVDHGSHGGLEAVRTMGRANGKAFDGIVDGASAGTAKVAGVRAGSAVRRDAHLLSQPVRFVANFGLGAARGLGEAGGELVKGTGDLAVGALRVTSDAQYRAKLGHDAKALWHAAKPAMVNAAHHPGQAARTAGHAIKGAVNKTLDEGEAAQRNGGFAEWDGHFAFKLATNIVTSVMPGSKGAKLEEAASAVRGGLEVAGAANRANGAAHLAEGANAARALRPRRAAMHAMADLGDDERAAVRFEKPNPSEPNAFQRFAADRKAAKASAPAGPHPGGMPPLTEQMAFQFAIQKDNKPGSWFEANCKWLSKEQVLAKLESVSAKELEAKAPYCHAFLKASALSRETGIPMVVDAHAAFQHLRKPIEGMKALRSAKAGAARFLPDGLGGVEGQGRRARYSAAQAITGVAGTATELDRKLVLNVIAKHVPAQMIEALMAKGVDIAAVRDSIVERLPHLRGQQMADYTAQTGEQTKGVYFQDDAKKLVVIASVPAEGEKAVAAGARRIPYRGNKNTVDVVLHEIAHAVDFNLHGANEYNRLCEGRAFRNAVALDTANIQKRYVEMGHSEIFAEYMARFMRQPEDLRQRCPNLYAYFHTLINQLPKR